MSMEKIHDRLTKLEVVLDNLVKTCIDIKSDIRTIKEETIELKDHVNNEIALIRQELIHYKILMKILIFIASITTAGFIGLLFDLVRRAML